MLFPYVTYQRCASISGGGPSHVTSYTMTGLLVCLNRWSNAQGSKLDRELQLRHPHATDLRLLRDHAQDCACQPSTRLRCCPSARTHEPLRDTVCDRDHAAKLKLPMYIAMTSARTLLISKVRGYAVIVPSNTTLSSSTIHADAHTQRDTQTSAIPERQLRYTML